MDGISDEVDASERWRVELDRSIIIEGGAPTTTYLDLGRRALMRRRAALAAAAAGVVMAAYTGSMAVLSVIPSKDSSVATEPLGHRAPSESVEIPSSVRTASISELESMPSGVPITLAEGGESFILRPGWRVDRMVESNGGPEWTARWAFRVFHETTGRERWVQVNWLAYSAVAVSAERPGQPFQTFSGFAEDATADVDAP